MASARTVSSNLDFGVEQFFRADEFRAVDPSPKLILKWRKTNAERKRVIYHLRIEIDFVEKDSLIWYFIWRSVTYPTLENIVFFFCLMNSILMKFVTFHILCSGISTAKYDKRKLNIGGLKTFKRLTVNFTCEFCLHLIQCWKIKVAWEFWIKLFQKRFGIFWKCFGFF